MNSPSNDTPEHLVTVYFNYGIKGLNALYELEDVLAEVIKKNGAGEYDGHEIAMDLRDGILFMYGSDAEHLFKTVQPVLKECSFMKGAKAILRFGPFEDGVKEIEIEI